MASLNIRRLPGEDEAEYQRRYGREKMRIYRANLPRVGRGRKLGQKNKKHKSDSLFTEEQWREGQQREGESLEDWKRRYSAFRASVLRARNPQKARAQSRAFYSANRAAELVRNKTYRAANMDKLKAYSKRYYAANKDRRKAALRAWNTANPDRVKARAAKWRAANRALCAYYSGTWRKACRDQTPIWANPEKILAIYAEATRIGQETGVPQHVDHEIPLRGATVSGLHVETNLRIIPAIENMRKHNKLLEA